MIAVIVIVAVIALVYAVCENKPPAKKEPRQWTQDAITREVVRREEAKKRMGW